MRCGQRRLCARPSNWNFQSRKHGFSDRSNSYPGSRWSGRHAGGEARTVFCCLRRHRVSGLAMRRERKVMKKRNLLGPEVAGNISYLSNEAAMTSGVTARKRGSLNRATLARLGKCLQDYLDEVRKQEVPERFKLLLWLGNEGSGR